MIKFLILIILVAIGAAYYMGFFTTDDSPKDMMEKVTSATKEKMEEAKDSAKDVVKDAVKEGLEEAQDAVK
jgi:uncharacterized protein (UPF0333 family)